MRLWWQGRWEAVDGHGAFLERKGGRRRRARGRWRFRNAMALLAVLVLSGPILAGAPAARATEPIFGLPLAGSPGPSTWYVSQWYGYTVWSYHNWQDLYAAGQGLHFGVDFAAPCGTPARAIGAGVVFAVDGPYGSAPHNIVVDHGNGYLSLYGHLRERSALAVGQTVAPGDIVGHTGDPASAACDQAPHLHLEIRRTGMGVAVNPVPLIDADWNRLAQGMQTPGARFVLDYARPSDHQTPIDQPEVTFGGPNVYERVVAWPPR